MSQLTDNLSAIVAIKSDIKDAIEAKGVSMSGVSFGSYADKIGEITTQFVTVPLSVSVNGTYTPGQGVDGFSQVIVNVSQSVTGYTEKDITEGVQIDNVSNSASYVGSYVFVYRSVRTVDLPSCKAINAYAFASCKSLYSVYVPECSVIDTGAFQSCSNLTIVSIPKCSRLGGYAFYYCSHLTTIDLPVCSRIEDYAFAQCYSSLSMVLLRSTSVCSYNGANIVWGTPDCNFYVTKSLVESYKSTGGWARISDRIYPILDDFEFSNGLVTGWAKTMDSGYLNTLGITANDVTSVSMQFLTSVSSSTFMNHQNLTSVSIILVEEYPDDLFNNTGFSEFNINVSTLGNRVFANCSRLEKVFINYDGGIVNAGSNLFQNCPNLSQIAVVDFYYSDYLTAPGWSEYSSLMYPEVPLLAFNNGLVYGRTTTIDSTYRQTLGITSNQVISVSLPNCKYVGSSTFYSHQSLVSVNLPECSYIGYGAFREDNKIESITIPKCEYIGDTVFQGAFQHNTTGQYMTLDLPVCSYIGSSAFYWTQRSWTITLGSTNVCSMSNWGGLTNNTTVRSMYVPSSLVEAYKSTYTVWNNIIFPIPE